MSVRLPPSCNIVNVLNYMMKIVILSSPVHFNFPPSHPKCRQNEYFTSWVILIVCCCFYFFHILHCNDNYFLVVDCQLYTMIIITDVQRSFDGQ